jgi:hypothetical protein
MNSEVGCFIDSKYERVIAIVKLGVDGKEATESYNKFMEINSSVGLSFLITDKETAAKLLAQNQTGCTYIFPQTDTYLAHV